MTTTNETTIEKKFGKLHVEIDLLAGRISIVGDWNSNFGRYYPHNFSRFKNHPKGEDHDWNRPQVIGMEWDYGLGPKVTEWLCAQIDKIKAD